MRVVDEIRALRLAQLKAEYGSYSKLNELLGRSSTDATLSQIANRSLESKTKKPRVMGSTQARALEKACKREEGWMDTDPDLVALPGWEQLPIAKREELLGLFAQYVAGELAKMKIAPAQKDEHATGESLNHVNGRRRS